MEPGRGLPPLAVPAAVGAGAVAAAAAAAVSDRALQPGDLPRAAAALAVFLVVGLLSGRLAVSGLPALPAPARRLLLLVLTALPTVLGARFLDATVSNDEAALLLQAELFASGRLAEPLPAPSCPPVPGQPGRLAGVCPLHRRQVLEMPERGVRFSKYPPGASLALAPAAAAGAPWLAVLAAGLLDLLLVSRLARRLSAPAWPVALLLVLSPFFLLVQASYQSEVFSAPAVLAAAACLLAVRSRPDAVAPAVGLGAACGAVFLVRPLTGVAVAVAMLPGLLARTGDGRRPGLRALAGAVLGGLPFLAAFLLYDRLQTGSWWQTPYDLYARRFGPFDAAGAPVDVYGRGDPVAGLLEQIARSGIMLGGVLGLWLTGWWGLWRLRRADGGSLLLCCLLLPLAYAWHWFPGHWAYPGPLYAYETLGLVSLGAAALLRDAAPAWRRATAAGVAAGLLLLLPWRAGLLAEAVARRAAPARVAAASAPPRAVVLLPFAGGRHLKDWLPSRPPFGDAPVLVQELPDPAATPAVLRALGLLDRPVRRFVPGPGPADGHLEPWSP